ncbi:DUF2188 domain-containing protein [Cupriavidus necator]|uniref:DUF2188 domain-containing protein n=1 Tax=Cupriavidus necator TaxID=106590 RepID=UPI001F2BEA28|nr:DUF2188 domain-containing protein [Cupriavidus necator]
MVPPSDGLRRTAALDPANPLALSLDFVQSKTKAVPQRLPTARSISPVKEPMERRIIRVVPAVRGWAVLVPGNNEAQCQCSTMEDAIAAGWALAKCENAELHITRHDGIVRSGADPKEERMGELRINLDRGGSTTETLDV